jgi:hypothetical protein
MTLIDFTMASQTRAIGLAALRIIVLTALLSALSVSFASAETLEPTGIKYDFEKAEEGGARSCRLAVIISNFPAPEAAIFRVLAAMSMTVGGGIHYGFTFDVGDTTFQSGLPLGMVPAPLQSAEFLSPIFNSTGRLQRVGTADGGYVAVSRDPKTTADFLLAVTQGNFEIGFSRTSSQGTRVYRIREPPPPTLMAQFLECAQTYR